MKGWAEGCQHGSRENRPVGAKLLRSSPTPTGFNRDDGSACLLRAVVPLRTSCGGCFFCHPRVGADVLVCYLSVFSAELCELTLFIMNDLEFLLGDNLWIIENRPIRAAAAVLFLFFTSPEQRQDQERARNWPGPDQDWTRTRSGMGQDWARTGSDCPGVRGTTFILFLLPSACDCVFSASVYFLQTDNQ